MCHLGSGGFGKTYEVRDGVPHTLSEHDSSLKVLKVLINNHPKYVELFQREAQVLSKLKHPGIPKAQANAYFIFTPRHRSEPLHCLVMEKIEGLNLQQYLEQRGSPIGEKLAIQWLIQLTNILQEVHDQNFFHRDIKPSNIMLKVDGQLVLIDFGTAREITESFVVKQAAGQVTEVVSAGYTPPEQLNGQAMPQSDFFDLGRTFVYLLTGKPPNKFYDFHTDELHWRNAALGISPYLANFLDQLMARFPHQRPQTAEVIRQQLTAINNVSSTGIPSQPTRPLNLSSPETTPYRPYSPSPIGQPASATQQLVSPMPPAMSATQPLAPTTPPTQSQLDPGFIQRCQQELAEFIGPIASIICKRTLSQNSSVSATEFVEALAKQIPNQKEALKFKQRLLP